jgi:hypothetical protein
MARSGKAGAAVWAARLAFLTVFVINMMCVVQFVLWPGGYAGAYELSGVPGDVAIRGIGIAFAMWNVTYPLVIFNPDRFRTVGWIVLAQQLVGLVGESWILSTLPAGHDLLASSILRFIVFDGAGLVLMAAAFFWMLAATRHKA